MAVKRSATARTKSAGRPPATVEDFFAELSHPLAPALAAVRAGILAASPGIAEGIKWNAPSFHMGDEQYFATANIHARGKTGETVLVVLHRGARAKAGRVQIADPDELIEWMSPDRGVIRFRTMDEATAGIPALQAVVRQWITQL